jgi:outer membrane protein assembly factor BamB
MKSLKTRAMTISVSLFLMFAMAFSLALPPVSAGFNNETQAAIDAGMTWPPPGAQYADANASSSRLLMWERYGDQVPTWTYGVLSPNPVGAGQEMTIVMFNPQVPHASADANDIRYEYSVEITKPDDSTVRLPASGTITSDSTGTAYTVFTPEETGNYSVTIIFHELFYRWYDSSAMREFYGVTLQESSHTYTLVVQDEPVEPVAVTSYPLPTEFWLRPIEGQNNAWGQVSSYWLNNAHDRDLGSSQNRIQPEGSAPESGHILWTKVTEDGGVVGGDQYFSDPGEVFNAGHQYQTRFTNQIIMMGRLYYEVPNGFSGGGGGWMCVDLKTGEDLWDGPRDFGTALQTISFGSMTFTIESPISPSFGYYYDWDNMNQHGIVNPSWMFTSNFGMSIQPRYGTVGALNLTNVPSGTEVIGPQGEVIRYCIQNAGNNSNPSYRLLQWNSSRVFTSDTGEINAGNPSAYDWNVSLPIANTLEGSISIRGAIIDDVLLCSNGTFPTAGTGSLDYDNPEEGTMWAVSLQPGHQGATLFGPKNYQMTFDDGSQNIFIRAGDGVWIMQHMPDLVFTGYSMYTGEKLWETESQADLTVPFGYFTWVSLMNVFGHAIYDGRFYTAGYTGHVFCYNVTTGDLLWLYEAPTHARIFEYYTLFLGTIADGKVYVGTHEHSADTPLYKGNRVRCLNATTGDEIWTMLGWAHPQTMAIADGVLVYWNNYDHQVYAVGKGPSSTTVTAGPKTSVFGSRVVVEGNVMDVSAGTLQAEQAARFPNGVPAVSDASQSEWMEYVYMQKPRPTNATGVDVIISVVDPNGNCYEVGTATSDASGMFTLSFVPEVPGDYTVFATFDGSNSYYGSFAETSLTVEDAPASTPESTPMPESAADLYFLPVSIGMIVAIVIVLVLLVLLYRKR